MIFCSPSWVPPILHDIPDSVPVGQMALEAASGIPRKPEDENEILVDAVTGKSYSVDDIRTRVEHLATGLGHELGWSPSAGDPWDKVVAIFSLNTLDYIVCCWAAHRLNGIVLPLHVGTDAAQLQDHLKCAKAKAIFTCHSLLGACDSMAAATEIPGDHIFLMDVSGDAGKDVECPNKSLDHLVQIGSSLEPLEPLNWTAGQGKKQVAYLASTSGTAGKQKLAKITHYNIIINIHQTLTYDSYSLKNRAIPGVMVLPMSHSYALEATHFTIRRGDRLVLHPKFDIVALLQSLKPFKVERLYLIPAIISALAKNNALLDMFDCSTVNSIVSGGGAMSIEVWTLLNKAKPDWNIIVAYGLTESSIIATFGSSHDIVPGSSGMLLPRVELRLIDSEGAEVETRDTPGTVLLRGPNMIPGYLVDGGRHHEVLDADGWLHTGDVGLMRPSGSSGDDHLFIIDRLKDIIKVKGIQVSPLEIEAQLITHPAIKDVAVIGVPHEGAGERAMAYVVRKPSKENDEEAVRESISDHIKTTMRQECWLGNRIVFIQEIPRTPSGKPLKETLKQWAREARQG